MNRAIAPDAPWKKYWADFGDLTYLNFAGHAARPLIVRDALERSVALALRPDRLDDREFFEVGRTTRRVLASLIGAAEGDVALTTGASAALAHCAQALSWQPGDEIVLVGGDFPSQHATWMPWAKRMGLTLRVIRPSSRLPTADDLVASVSPRTRVVSVSHVRFDDGSLLDVPKVAEACRRHGALLVLDVSQSCGVIPIDVGHLGADAIACAGYKYVLGPWGAGFLWIGPRAREAFELMPSNWLAQSATTFRDLSYDEPTLRQDAARWDAAESGTPFNFNLCAFGAAAAFVAQVGVETVHGHVLGLLATLRESAGEEVPWITPAGPGTHGPFLCLEGKTPAHGQAVHEVLKEQGIVTALRNGRVRIAPYLLHTQEDMRRVAQKLRAALGLR